MILILYTTLYRRGGKGFERAAVTMAQEKQAEFPDREVRSVPVESKEEFRALIDRISEEGREIVELHFIGHSGVYGIMSGTTDWPEQFSPHEWRSLSIPFAPEARAWFHACRTARWFAPFFARTFGVQTMGYHWYTTFSRSPKRFQWEPSEERSERPLYIVSIAGKKSHGLVGSLRKYAGLGRLEPMLEFQPHDQESGGSYDRVADLYDEAFADIRVREDEWEWVQNHIPEADDMRLLEIGCGNGSLLAALSDRIASGIGVDASAGMIDRARRRFGSVSNISFNHVTGPSLPVEDRSIDVVISFMSFRYLDWDPIMAEVRRVLRPGGRVLIVDMAAAPIRLRDLPDLIRSKLRHRSGVRRHPGFHRNLERLVSDVEWMKMLRYNPVRAEHEYRWYLASRFPAGEMVRLNVAMTHRLLAFDSGPVEPGEAMPQSYP